MGIELIVCYGKDVLAGTLTMAHFIAIERKLFYSFPLEEKEKIHLDGFLSLLESSGVYTYIDEYTLKSPTVRGATFNQYRLFATVLLGFTIGKPTLREIESSCRNDLRFIYVMGGAIPSYSTISRFIKDFFIPRKNVIYSCITNAIFENCRIEMDTLFLDGTKQEANANKYKFVWKPTKYHEKLSAKIRALLERMRLGKDIPSEGIIPSAIIANKIKDAEELSGDGIEGGEKALKGMRTNLAEYLLKSIEYEEKENICGPDRNSYYKTDHDATAMCLKEDYYSGLGSNMHAAYSVQALISHGFIVSCFISQHRNDLHTLQPTIENFHQMYGVYPKRLVADAGYGDLDNYKYCSDNNIKAFIKYTAWRGESSGLRPSLYEFLENDKTIKCLGGRKGEVVTFDNRHPKRPGALFYIIRGCNACEFMPYCKSRMADKTSDERIFEVQPEFMILKQQARDRLLSCEGIEMRVNRSCQIEGAFGIIKQDMMYRRFRRRSLDKVFGEFILVCLGFNIRKYMRYHETGKLPRYWTPPADLNPGEFKKPSVKRLLRRINRKNKPSVNEIAKSSHQYKN